MASRALLRQFSSSSAVCAAAANAAPVIGPVVISELMVDPGNGAEFIELTNITATAVPLFDPEHPKNQWQIIGVGPYVIAPGTTLPPYGTLLIVATEPANFRAQYNIPDGVPILGPYGGQLSNSGERIALIRNGTLVGLRYFGRLVDSFNTHNGLTFGC